MVDLLGIAILFLIIALIAYVFGARGIAGLSMEIAKILIMVAFFSINTEMPPATQPVQSYPPTV